MLIRLVFEFAGTPVVEGSIETFVEVLMAIVGIIMVYVGRQRLGGLTPLGFRKPIDQN